MVSILQILQGAVYQGNLPTLVGAILPIEDITLRNSSKLNGTTSSPCFNPLDRGISIWTSPAGGSPAWAEAFQSPRSGHFHLDP